MGFRAGYLTGAGVAASGFGLPDTGLVGMSEMAGRKNRGFWSSFQFMTLIMGQLTALAVQPYGPR